MGYQALLFCPDEKTARTVTHVLNDLDFAVEPCTEPFAAVKKLMAQHFDAVVVDCDNEQNATLLFKSARNSSSNQSSLAVAVVEGQAGVAKAFRIGANLVLTKPINVEQAKGTLRVARGLLRKGTEATRGTATVPAAAAPAPQVTPSPKATPSVPVSRPAPQAAPSAPARPAASAQKPGIAAIPVKPVVAPSIPSVAASTSVEEVDDLDSDAILEPDTPEPMMRSHPAADAATDSAPAPTSTAPPKFPWQPSAKMAEPMASALRRAAEAAGQVEPAEPIETETPVVAKAPVATKAPAPTPAPEKRLVSGAMFQARGHAAAPAPAIEKPATPVAAAPTIEDPPAVTRPAARETRETKAERLVVVDTTTSDVAPPTFFPGGYDADEAEGGGKTKALVIVAAVVLLAASAGYLSWRNTHSGKTSSTATQAAQTAPTPAAAPSTAPQDSAPTAPVTTDITLGSAPAGLNTSSPRPSPAKPSPKTPAVDPEPDPEPEVTQRIVVKSDTRHLAPTTRTQDSEPVQAPSAIGMDASADTKALASISNATASVPKPSAQMLKVSQGVMEGLVLKRVQPRYPPQAQQMRIQGPVQLQATISKEGDIQNLKVVSGDAVLARAAQEAVKQWKYKPYFLNGEPVQIETQILVNFRLPN